VIHHSGNALHAAAASYDLESQSSVNGTNRGMTLPFESLVVTFKDVHYFVPMPQVQDY